MHSPRPPAHSPPLMAAALRPRRTTVTVVENAPEPSGDGGYSRHADERVGVFEVAGVMAGAIANAARSIKKNVYIEKPTTKERMRETRSNVRKSTAHIQRTVAAHRNKIKRMEIKAREASRNGASRAELTRMVRAIENTKSLCARMERDLDGIGNVEQMIALDNTATHCQEVQRSYLNYIQTRQGSVNVPNLQKRITDSQMVLQKDATLKALERDLMSEMNESFREAADDATETAEEEDDAEEESLDENTSDFSRRVMESVDRLMSATALDTKASMAHISRQSPDTSADVARLEELEISHRLNRLRTK